MARLGGVLLPLAIAAILLLAATAAADSKDKPDDKSKSPPPNKSGKDDDHEPEKHPSPPEHEPEEHHSPPPHSPPPSPPHSPPPSPPHTPPTSPSPPPPTTPSPPPPPPPPQTPPPSPPQTPTSPPPPPQTPPPPTPQTPTPPSPPPQAPTPPPPQMSPSPPPQTPPTPPPQAPPSPPPQAPASPPPQTPPTPPPQTPPSPPPQAPASPPPQTPPTPPPQTPPSPPSQTPPSSPPQTPPSPPPQAPESAPPSPPQVPETPPPPTAQAPETPSPPPPQVPETPPSALPPKAQGPKPMKVKCHVKKLDPYCYNKMMECPDACSQSCFADCDLCKPVCVCSVPGACGDPRFIGGDGNAFYFHGHKDADFCVLSDRDLHINAHFIGKRGADMSRDFTWIQAIAVLFDGHSIYVGAKKTAKWDDAIDRLDLTLDGEPMHLPKDQIDGATWTSRRVPALSVTRTKAANGVLIVLDGRFSVRANAVPITEEDSRVHHYGKTADDSLAHLELAFKFDALTDDVHGVVGQTYRRDYVNRFDVKAAMPTMGGKDSFATSNLFAADCAVARFGVSPHNVDATVMSELAGVTCASGIDGQGVVCKK